MLVAFASLGFLYAVCSPSKPSAPSSAPATTNEAKQHVSPAEPAPAERTCVLSIPGDTNSVLVFPTEEGLDEFGKAAASGDAEAMNVSRRANGGFFVESGTKCTWLDLGLLQTKVRVLAGPHTGRAGYVPTEWARSR